MIAAGWNNNRLRTGGRLPMRLGEWLLASALCLVATAASAQEQSYWLQRGGTVVGSCPGASQGEPLKAANTSLNGWLMITAIVDCRDAGNVYSFEVRFLRVSINPRARERITRDTLNFDWLGLAVYKPQDGGRTIAWLYDEALPIRGSLRKDSDASLHFGNMKFDVPKAAISQASNFTFYLTSEGPLYAFGLL
jgi:hypothetical protein